MQIKRLPYFLFSLALLHFCVAGSAPGLFAQEKPVDATVEGQDTVVILPIPVVEISEEYDNSNQFITKVGKLQISDEEMNQMYEVRDTILRVVDEYISDDPLKKLESANVRELDNVRFLVDIYIDQISDYQSRITKRTRDISEATIELSHAEDRWVLTRELTSEEGIPEVVRIRVKQIIGKLDSVNKLLQDDFSTLLIEEDALSDRNNVLKGLRDSILTRKQIIGESLFARDMAPLFQDPTIGDSAKVLHHIERMETLWQADVEMIKQRFKVELWVIVILMLVFVGLAIWFKRNYSNLNFSDQFELTETHKVLIESPVAAVLFITILLMRFIFKELFISLQVINLFLLMIPMIVILVRRYVKQATPAIELLMGFYFLTYFYEIFFFPDIFQRIFLLFLSFTGALFFSYLFIKRVNMLGLKSPFIYGIIRFLLLLFATLCVIAVIGNLTGANQMAEYFTLTFMQITIVIMAIFVATKVVSAFVYLLLAGKTMQKLYMVKDNFLVLHKKISRFINIFLWVFLFFAILDLLNLKEQFEEWGSETLKSGWTIGAVELTPESILIFIFVIWLSVFLSRAISTILDKDVFTRIPTAKGIPQTVIMLLKITLITGGFFLAAAAAGMELSNLSIIIGAFSVGIGFGLQNVFNNMVSGLILAFERPIKVGDVVQVGELMGEVLIIGFRASTIKSFDGAEVIVPNGNLISEAMINWTLTDYLRRMDLRVGVAYGTDPEVVLGILKSVAEEHEKVRDNPAPSAFFLGFGDSSLDFRLLGWTNIDGRLTVESQLNVSINSRLAEAGIEIPFPQRDLHIRSDDTKE